MRLKTVILLACLCVLTVGTQLASAQIGPAIGNITSAGATCSATSPSTNCVTLKLDGLTGAATILITGTFVGTGQFEVSNDGLTTWTNINCTPPNSTTAASSATATGSWQCNVAGWEHIRVRCSAYTSGTISVVINGAHASAKSGGGSPFSSGGATVNVVPKGDGAGKLADSSITDASGVVQLGASGSGTNTVGVGDVLQPGIGTGTATPAQLTIKGDNLLTSSSSTAHVPIVRWTTPSTTGNLKSLTNNTATLFGRVVVSAGKTIALIIRYHVEVNDGTNTQEETGMATFSGIAVTAGTITAGTPAKFGNAQTVSAGTLAVSFTAVVNGSNIDCKITSNTSLTSTTHRVVIDVVNLSPEGDVTFF